MVLLEVVLGDPDALSTQRTNESDVEVEVLVDCLVHGLPNLAMIGQKLHLVTARTVKVYCEQVNAQRSHTRFIPAQSRKGLAWHYLSQNDCRP